MTAMRRRGTTRLEALLALALLALALGGAWMLQGPQIGATIRAMRERLFGEPAPPSVPGA